MCFWHGLGSVFYGLFWRFRFGILWKKKKIVTKTNNNEWGFCGIRTHISPNILHFNIKFGLSSIKPFSAIIQITKKNPKNFDKNAINEIFLIEIRTLKISKFKYSLHFFTNSFLKQRTRNSGKTQKPSKNHSIPPKILHLSLSN